MLFPGLYGLIDNSYLEITYMLFFIYGLIVFENEIIDDPDFKWLLHFKTKNNNEIEQNKTQ